MVTDAQDDSRRQVRQKHQCRKLVQEWELICNNTIPRVSQGPWRRPAPQDGPLAALCTSILVLHMVPSIQLMCFESLPCTILHRVPSVPSNNKSRCTHKKVREISALTVAQREGYKSSEEKEVNFTCRSKEVFMGMGRCIRPGPGTKCTCIPSVLFLTTHCLPHPSPAHTQFGGHGRFCWLIPYSFTEPKYVYRILLNTETQPDDQSRHTKRICHPTPRKVCTAGTYRNGRQREQSEDRHHGGKTLNASDEGEWRG